MTTSNPDYVRGWNAAISHAEDYLVSLGYIAGATQGVPNSRAYTSWPSFAQRVIMAAAEKIGRARKYTARTFG